MGDERCIKLIKQFFFPYRQTYPMAQLPGKDVDTTQRIDCHATLSLAIQPDEPLPHMGQFKRQLRCNGSVLLAIKRMASGSIDMLTFLIAIGRFCRPLKLGIGKAQQSSG